MKQDGETDRNESFPTDQQADPAPTMIIRPLSPDCLSPQTHINRIIGPRYEMFEPVRPQQLRRMPLPPRYLPPQSENVGFSGRRPEIISKRPLTLGSSSRCEERNPKHPVPAPLHQHDILSDESDHGANVNDIHDSISSDEEEEIGNQVEVEEIDIPDLQMSLLSHLVDMGFEATIALPALHDAYIDINDGNNEQHDDLNMFLALVKAVSDAHDEEEYHGSHGKDGDTETENLTLHAMDLISEDEEGDVEIAGQLNQRNEHLEYLIHYIEQDRNAVLLENEELKSMLDKYRLREQQQEEAMLSLSSLRKRIQVNEHKHREHMKRMRQNEHVIETLRRRLQELTGHTQSLHLLSVAELRDLEDTLDTALYKARAIKEQKIMEQREALDRQVEVQQEQKLCVICMAAEKTILCLPCRHVCMCETCANHSEVLRCPICRLDIEEKMVIYA
ncbi:unnamed protein product [Aphanomyces euteiches]